MLTTGAQRLQSPGLRVTRPRLAVLAVLDDAAAQHEHLAMAEVALRARATLGTLSKQARSPARTTHTRRDQR